MVYRHTYVEWRFRGFSFCNTPSINVTFTATAAAAAATTTTTTNGPTLWNSLPEQLRQMDITFRQFKPSLKTLNVWLAGGRGALCLNVKGAD